MGDILNVQYSRRYTIQRIVGEGREQLGYGVESVNYFDPNVPFDENDSTGVRLVMEKIREQERKAREHHGPNIHFIPSSGERIVTRDITKKFEGFNG